MPQRQQGERRLAPITAACLTALPGIAHGFFTRQGGVSTGIYADLNCGLGSYDIQENVGRNRTLVSAHLGAQHLVTVHQVHSAVAVRVDGPIARNALPRADALVTTVPRFAIGVLSADCTPVLFADPQARVIAAAHAGWRGAVGGVLEAAISKMEEAGAHRDNIRAAVGPCIHQDAYEVGPEFQTQVVSEDADNERFFRVPPGKLRAHFDLPGYVVARLARMNLAAVESQSVCTFAHPDLLYSYRRAQKSGESDYGRQVAAIALT
jgi:YfiH family protein